MCHTTEIQLMRGCRSVCFHRSAVWCVHARHADINKRRAQWRSLLSESWMQLNLIAMEDPSLLLCVLPSFYSLRWNKTCVASSRVHLHRIFWGTWNFFVWVATVHMINLGPTQEVTPPCSPVQNPPTPTLLRSMGKRETELLASGFTLPEASPSAPSQKTPLFPGRERGRGGAKESREARPPGQRLPRRWALGTLPKTTRRRGSQTQSISVRW